MAAEVSGPALAIAAATIFIAATARGFSGFGAALIFVPIGSALLGPQLAVPLLFVVDGVMTLPLIPRAIRHCHWRDVLLLFLGSVLGVPLGTAILAHADPVALRWAISLIIVALLLVLASGWRFRDRPVVPLTAGVGVGAGVLSGAAQIGGPPIVVYWLGRSMANITFRANIIVYFALSTVLSTITYLVGGLLSLEVVRAALIAAPLYGAGLWVGSRVFGLASQTLFRRTCYTLIGISAVASVPVFDTLWASGRGA